MREERIIRKDQPAGYCYVRVVGCDGAWDADNSYLLRFKVVYRWGRSVPW